MEELSVMWMALKQVAVDVLGFGQIACLMQR
jgi:hypothetical protein